MAKQVRVSTRGGKREPPSQPGAAARGGAALRPPREGLRWARKRPPDGKRDALDRLRCRQLPVAAVSGERLVAAVAVERHGDMPAGQLAELERRQASRVGEWLAEVPCHARKEIGVGGP